MKEIFIGEYIKHRRQELGLRQKDLCEGICEQVTLSRLENGRQYPSRTVMNALLQRLDLSAEHYIAVLSDQEIKIENLREEINALTIQRQHAVEPMRSRLRQQVFEKFKELDELGGDEEDKISRQFFIRIKTMMGQENGSPYPAEIRLNMFLEALLMTVPKFDLDNINGFVYTLDEIKLINNIAGCFDALGEYDKLTNLLGQLFEYLKQHAPNIIRGRGHLPMIATNYARALNLCGRNEQSLEICEYARQACINYSNYQMLPRIIHILALAHHDLGHEEESREMFCESYYLCKATGDNINLVNLKKDAWDYYGIKFE